MLKLITKEQLLIAAAEQDYRETLQELEAEIIADCKATSDNECYFDYDDELNTVCYNYPSTERHNTIIESDWSNAHIPF